MEPAEPECLSRTTCLHDGSGQHRALRLLPAPQGHTSAGRRSTLLPGPSCRRTPLQSSRQQQQRKQQQQAAAGSAPALDASRWRAPPAAARCQRRARSRCALAATRPATATSSARSSTGARTSASAGRRRLKAQLPQRGRAGRRARSLDQTLHAVSSSNSQCMESGVCMYVSGRAGRCTLLEAHVVAGVSMSDRDSRAPQPEAGAAACVVWSNGSSLCPSAGACGRHPPRPCV